MKISQSWFVSNPQAKAKPEEGVERAKAKAKEAVASAKREEGVEKAKANAEEGAEKAKANAEEGVASAKAEDGAQITMSISEESMGKGKANADDITRAKAEEVASTIDIDQGALEVKMDSSAGESLVKLKSWKELGRRSEMQIMQATIMQATTRNLSRLVIDEVVGDVKMSKAKRAKMKAENKMKAMAEKVSWAYAEEVAMTTEVRAKEAAEIAKLKAEGAEEAGKIAKLKAGEVEEAAEIANLKAGEVEEAAETAKSKAGEVEEAAKIAKAAVKMSKAKRAKMKAMAEKASWAEAEEVPNIAAMIAKLKAKEVAMTTKVRAKEAAKIAKSKAEEAEEAANIANSKAEEEEEAKEAAEIAKLKAGEVEEAARIAKAAVKMSKARRAKKKAANKMKAMADKASWAEAVKVAMTTKVSAKEAAKIAKSKAEEAEEAAKIANSKAEEAEEAAEAAKLKVGEVEEAAKIAKLKAEEAAKIAKSKAEEAEEAAEVAKSKADEATKAKEAADEVRRLKEKAVEWAQCDEELFTVKFRSFWNKLYTGLGATFQQNTSIPAMLHSYPDSGCSADAMETLQVMSVKVTSIKECLHWPLQVFGMIAARDVLDHKRNIIFHRPRSNCQIITQDDRYLTLTGPTRAIAVSTDPSYIEVSLTVKGRTKSEDKDLSEFVVMFRSGCCFRGVYPSRLSMLELEFVHMALSVEATVSIKIIGGSWPDGFRGAFSAGTSGHEDLLVKLLDSGHAGLPVDADGVIKLSRRVVSVELEKKLKVSVMACPVNEGHVAESSEAVLEPQRAGKSPPGIKLCVGSCSMEVSVAWSCFRHEFC